jgi:hypothetical protein
MSAASLGDGGRIADSADWQANSVLRVTFREVFALKDQERLG